MMLKYKAFNPSDYMMVGGKVVRKKLPSYKVAGTVGEDDETGGKVEYSPTGIDARGQTYTRSGNPAKDFAIENAYSGTAEEIEAWATAQGYPGYGDDRYGERFYKVSANGKNNIYKIKNIDGKGKTINVFRDINTNEVVKTLTFVAGDDGKPVDDNIIVRDYKEKNGVKYHEEKLYKADGVTVKQDLGIGPGFGGYDFLKEDFEGSETYQNLDKYNQVLDANPEMVDAMYDKYKKMSTAEGLTVLPKDKYLEILKKGQRDNALISSVYGDDALQGTYWDKPFNDFGSSISDNTNQAYESAARELGFNPMTTDEIKQFQAAWESSYYAINDDPEFIDNFRRQGLDFKSAGAPQTNEADGLSGVDGLMGNTSLGYRFKALAQQEEEQDVVEEPGKNKYYYCGPDGKPISVEVPEGTEPTAPEGATADVAYTSYAQTEAACAPEAEPLEQEIRPPLDTWFGNDIRNYLTALGQRIEKVPPTMFQQQPGTYGYHTLSPDTAIATTTGMANQYNNLLANTMSGPAAAAASLGAQGEFLDQLAQNVSNVQFKNIDVLNAAQNARAEITDSLNARNLGLRKQYADELATYRQQLTDSMNKKAALVNNMYNIGEQNRFDDELLRELYPQASYPDRLTMGRNWAWSGRGKNPFEPDLSGRSSSTQMDMNAAMSVYDDAYDSYIERHPNDVENAAKYAEAVQKEYFIRNRPSGSSSSDSYADARYRKNTSKFGGAHYGTPWGGY